MKPNDFQQLSILLAVVEGFVTVGRCQRLRFHSAKGQPVGSLVLDGGSIRFGVELAGQPYIDPLFASEVPLHSASLIKNLHGEPLTATEALRLTQLPLRARRAIRALTARAVLQLAWLCDPAVRAVASEPAVDAGGGPLRIAFSPSELMLAAGAVGDIRLDDPAVIEFETPPLPPKERWLFVCPAEDPYRPWPVMARLQSVLRVSHIIDKGRFCEQLIGHLGTLVPDPVTPGPMALLFTFDSQLHYVVKTSSYVALMIYPLEQHRRLQAALDTMRQRSRWLVVQISAGAIKSSQQSPIPVPNLSGRTPSESPHTELPRAEPFSVEPPRAESAGVESARAEPPRVEPPSAQSASSEPPKVKPPSRQSPVAPALAPEIESAAGSSDPLAGDWYGSSARSGESPRLPVAPDGKPSEAPVEAGPRPIDSEPPAADRVAGMAQQSLETGSQSQQSWPPSANAEVLSNKPIQQTLSLTDKSFVDILGKLGESIDGFIGAAIVDSYLDMCLGALGGDGEIDLELAAVSNSEVVRAERNAMNSLNMNDEIEEILITLKEQYHLIRSLRERTHVFIYLVLDRSRANLALARHALGEHERDMGL